MRKAVKHTAILITIIMVLMMAWESQKSDAAAVEAAIPAQSIRLRILANSDSAGDQLVKRQLRDRVVEQMNTWVAGLEDPQSLEQARTLIRSHLPELDALVDRELKERGLTYGHKVELGIVPFPTKMYGGTVYPAGDYEALRITLGAGSGQNWWCVLFPPLCFIDAGSGDAAAKPAPTDGNGAQADSAAKNGKTAAAGQKGAVKGAVPDGTGQAGTGGSTAAKAEAPQVKFFIVELLEKVFQWIASLWK
ncbi:stage II sporulation protein R [Paenibacillus spiritus]|uniref:Stage II sporulation protein R n=1 Tax=Paenibacillus spiritus TaxID=2496557 RepID=A0A5J5FXT6_9BACL|nr:MULTISPECIES: stage II sporulation protein R [Paenibacillus]KAA8998406.1 stage II sporulation protein R [Paenibacillus spiritus]